MQTIFSTIEEALTESDFSFFVVSPNEVHGFHTENEAENDCEIGKHQFPDEEICVVTRY